MASSKARRSGDSAMRSHGEWPDLKTMLGQDDWKIASQALAEPPVLSALGSRLLPPILNLAKIFCIGHNSTKSTGSNRTAERPTSPPSSFCFADTLVAHGQSGWGTGESVEIDYEGELAAIIGRAGRIHPTGAGPSSTSQVTSSSTTFGARLGTPHQSSSTGKNF